MAKFHSNIKPIVNTLKRCDYLKLLKLWKRLSFEDFGCAVETALHKVTRTFFANKFLELFKERKLTVEDFHQLDVIATYLNQHKKLWTAHTIQTDTDDSLQIGDECEEISALLARNVYPSKVNVVKTCIDDEVWLRISLTEKQSNRKRDKVFYVVYYCGTKVLLTNNIAPTLKKKLFKAFKVTFKADEIITHPLSGHHQRSLVKMILNCKNPELEFNAHLNQPMPTRTEKYLEEIQSKTNITDFSAPGKQNCIAESKRVFGVEPLPVLQKLTYKIQSKFRGDPCPPAMIGQPFSFAIDFEGSNVLEGMRQMTQNGLITLPLKRFVGNIQNEGRNFVEVHGTEKRRSAQQQESGTY